MWSCWDSHHFRKCFFSKDAQARLDLDPSTNSREDFERTVGKGTFLRRRLERAELEPTHSPIWGRQQILNFVALVLQSFCLETKSSERNGRKKGSAANCLMEVLTEIMSVKVIQKLRGAK